VGSIKRKIIGKQNQICNCEKLKHGRYFLTKGAERKNHLKIVLKLLRNKLLAIPILARVWKSLL